MHKYRQALAAVHSRVPSIMPDINAAWQELSITFNMHTCVMGHSRCSGAVTGSAPGAAERGNCAGIASSMTSSRCRIFLHDCGRCSESDLAHSSPSRQNLVATCVEPACEWQERRMVMQAVAAKQHRLFDHCNMFKTLSNSASQICMPSSTHLNTYGMRMANIEAIWLFLYQWGH